MSRYPYLTYLTSLQISLKHRAQLSWRQLLFLGSQVGGPAGICTGIKIKFNLVMSAGWETGDGKGSRNQICLIRRIQKCVDVKGDRDPGGGGGFAEGEGDLRDRGGGI